VIATSPNHIQDPQLLVPVDAKIGGDNISTQYTAIYVSHIEVHKPRFLHYERRYFPLESNS